MNKPFASLCAVLALAATPALAAAGTAATAGPSQPAASTAALYPLPTAHTPAAAAHASASAAAGYLATLSPSALAGTGGTKLGATASGPGTLTFTLTAKIHGKLVVIGRGSKTVSHAGAVTVKLALTKAGEAALASAKGALKVTVSATFKPKHGKAKTAKSTATLR